MMAPSHCLARPLAAQLPRPFLRPVTHQPHRSFHSRRGIICQAPLAPDYSSQTLQCQCSAVSAEVSTEAKPQSAKEDPPPPMQQAAEGSSSEEEGEAAKQTLLLEDVAQMVNEVHAMDDLTAAQYENLDGRLDALEHHIMELTREIRLGPAQASATGSVLGPPDGSPSDDTTPEAAPSSAADKLVAAAAALTEVRKLASFVTGRKNGRSSVTGSTRDYDGSVDGAAGGQGGPAGAAAGAAGDVDVVLGQQQGTTGQQQGTAATEAAPAAAAATAAATATAARAAAATAAAARAKPGMLMSLAGSSRTTPVQATLPPSPSPPGGTNEDTPGPARSPPPASVASKDSPPAAVTWDTPPAPAAGVVAAGAAAAAAAPAPAAAAGKDAGGDKRGLSSTMYEFNKLQSGIVELMNSGYIESVKQLRETLMIMEWDMTNKHLAKRRAVATFERYVVEMDMVQEVGGYEVLSSLYDDPDGLHELLPNDRTRMLARSMMEESLSDRRMALYHTCTQTAKEMANLSRGAGPMGAPGGLGLNMGSVMGVVGVLKNRVLPLLNLATLARFVMPLGAIAASIASAWWALMRAVPFIPTGPLPV